MKAQQIFDTVVHHLRQQKRKSQANNSDCLYYHPNGDKCAIGCLIPFDLYSEEMECTDTGILFFNFPELETHLKTDWDFDDYTFNYLLEWLQDIHDNFDVAQWENEWKKLAQELNLKHESY